MSQKLEEPVQPKQEADFDSLIETNEKFLTVVSFIAPWASHCNDLNDSIRELLRDPRLKHVLFIELPAENFPNISLRYAIKSVPSVIFLRNKKVLETLVGAETQKLSEKLMQLAGDGTNNVDGVPVKTIDRNSRAGESVSAQILPLEERLKKLINQANVMIFMKGNPAQPRCGFSRQVIELINATGVAYQTFDILEDEDVRQGLKTFSNWQTYPQIYVKGELIGGLDVIKEMIEMGSLEETLSG